MAVDINITPIIREVTIEIGQGGGAAVWGSISGTLADQTDLALQQTAQDTLISTNATDIGTNVTGILALSTSQNIQDTAIGLNTAKVSSPILKVVKLVDESRQNTTTPTLDDELFLTIEANTWYHVQMICYTRGDSAPDFQIGLTAPSDTETKRLFGSYYRDLDNTYSGTFGYGTTQSSLSLGSNNTGACTFFGYCYSETGGTVGVIWSQINLDALFVKILKGSNLILTKLN